MANRNQNTEGSSASQAAPSKSVTQSTDIKLSVSTEANWLERERQLVVDAFIQQLTYQSQALPSSNPLVQELNSVVRDIRRSAISDPFVKQLGIALPENFNIVLLSNAEHLAFVLPERPEVMFLSTGLVSFLEKAKLIYGTIAHEQAHFLFNAIEERQSNSSTTCDSHFGERVWLDPLRQRLLEQPSKQVLSKLFSRWQEHWCDTYGTFSVLNGVGVSPSVMTELFYKFQEDWRDGSNNNCTGIASILSLIASHPEDLARAWSIAELSSKLSYPATLKGEDPKSKKIEHLPELANFISREETLIKILYNESRVLDWFLLKYDDNDDSQIKLPYGKQALFSENFLKTCNDASIDLATVYAISLVLMEDLNQGTFSTQSAQSNSITDQREVSREGPKNKRETRSHLFKYERIVKNAGLEVPDKHALNIISQQNKLALLVKLIENSRLSKIEKMCMLDTYYQINSRNKNTRYLANSCEELAKVHIPVLCLDAFSIAKKLVAHITTHCFKYAYLSYNKLDTSIEEIVTKSEPDLVSQICFRIDLVESRFTLGTSLYIEKSLHHLISKRKIKDIHGILDLLSKIRDNCRDSAIDSSKITSPRALFQFALSSAIKLSKSDDELCYNLTAIHAAGHHPGMTYGESLIISKTIFFNLKTQNGIYEMLFKDKTTPTIALKTLYSLWPNYADFITRNFLHDKFKDEAYNDILLMMQEPFIQGSMWEGRNINDCTITITTSTKEDNNIAPFKSDVPLDSSSQLIEYLATKPNLLSPQLWSRLTLTAVKEIEDLKRLFNFVKATHAPYDEKLFPWRAKNQVDSLFEIINQALPQIFANILLPDHYDTVLHECIVLVKDLPRCSKRNQCVSALLELVKQSERFNPEIALELVRMIETEPASELLNEVASELREQSNYILDKLELAIERYGTRYIPENRYESLSNPKVELSNDYINILRKKAAAEYKRNNGRIPKHHIQVVFIDNYESSGIKNLFQTYLPKIKLPPVISLVALRYQMLEKVRKLSPAPQNNLQIYTKSVMFAEEAGLSMVSILGLQDPLTAQPFNSKSSLQDFQQYCSDIIERCQPVATPLRDQWFISSIEKYQKHSGQLSAELLFEIQKKIYLPQNNQHIGEIIWRQFYDKMKSDGPKTSHSNQENIAIFKQCFQFYSLLRNEALTELRNLISETDYETALQISTLIWEPGLPVPIPNAQILSSDFATDLQSKILSSFDDIDTIHFLLYSFGITAEPWHKEYMEYLLGAKLDNISELNQRMDPTARRAFLHKIFSGSEGLFAREDWSALEYMSTKIGSFIARIVSADQKRSALITDITRDILYKAGLPIRVRVEILAELLDWFNEKAKNNNSGKNSIQEEAELIIRIFKAGRASGMRLLQGLLYERGVFSDQHRIYLSNVQDNTGSGDPLIPFHVAETNAIHNPIFGDLIGAGCKAELHELQSVNGAELQDTLLKCERPDSMFGLANLRDPVIRIAATLEKYGINWSDKTIYFAIESCQKESRELAQEAERTGMLMGNVIAKALSGTLIQQNNYLEITYHLTKDSPTMRIALPRKVPISSSLEKTYCFALSDLGRNFKPLSRVERELVGQSLHEYLVTTGVPLTVFADTVCKFFVFSYLDGTLWKDPHRGNVGLISSDGKEPMIGLLDFGSVTDSFPEYWRNWTYLLTGAILNRDITQIRRSLITAWKQYETKTNTSIKDLNAVCELISETFDKINQTMQTGAELSSILNQVGDVIELIYNDWPLPAPLRDLCEAGRRVLREWAPFTSAAMRQEIMERYLGEVFTYCLDPNSDHYENLDLSLYEDRSPDIDYKLASGTEDLEWFRSHSELPKGAQIFYIKPSANNREIAWHSKTIYDKTELKSDWIRCTDNTTINIKEDMVGYFQIKINNGIRRLKFSDRLRVYLNDDG